MHLAGISLHNKNNNNDIIIEKKFIQFYDFDKSYCMWWIITASFYGLKLEKKQSTFYGNL